MNLIMLNTFDAQGGAAIATYRLHRGLRSIGINSYLLVQGKKTDDPTVVGPITKREKIIIFFRSYFEMLVKKLKRVSLGIIFSPAFLPDNTASKVATFNPDIVHLFWVNGEYIRPETLRKFNRPIVWTLHDMWPFTGGCHYDEECGRFQQSCGKCPILHSERDHDLSRRVWARKQKSWEGVPIVVVATSRWLADMARSSSLFKNQRIEVIPNGIDTEKYKPLDKGACRAAYGLPEDKRLILFSAFRTTTDKRKGNHLLVQALEKMVQAGLDEGTELLIVGASAPETPQNIGMRVHYMGHLHDEISQVLLYSAADVIVAPSMQENLSNTVMESLACGTPVVAFGIGGMPDLIDHQKSGYLATPFVPDDLASGIMWVLENKDRHNQLSKFARQKAVECYALNTVANQYWSLYQGILK